MSFLSAIFKRNQDRACYRALYEAVVRLGRDPCWYKRGKVPDTLNGRFDMIAALLALVLLRLEREGATASQACARITELFIADMEGNIRQIGIGDLKVSKHVGAMTAALGGRLGAFRAATNAGTRFEMAVRRNIFHENPPDNEAVRFVSTALERLSGHLAARPAKAVLAGDLPQL